MAKTRNYTPPTMIVRQHFVEDTTRQSVPALVHISGPHANFVSVRDTSAEQGFLGVYSPTAGLHVELPRCLAGNVLDRDSVSITLRNALLGYFKTTGETFVLPKGARNVVTCSESMQTANFSFRKNGPVDRAAVFHDRDVRAGDAVRVTANIGGEARELWTTVAAVVPRYTAGVVMPAAVAGNRNATAASESIGIIERSEAAREIVVSVGKSDDWYASLPARGVAEDTYLVEVVIGGTAAAARFRITSAYGDNLTSTRIEQVDDGDGGIELRLTIGNTGAYMLFPETVALTPEMNWTVLAEAAVEVNTPTASGAYLGAASEMQPRDVTYIVTVSRGGEIPETEPTTDAGRYACPTLSVTTTDGSDKMPVVRVVQRDKPIPVSRFGVEITFPGRYLIEGDKFFITCKSAYSDIFPTLVLNRNVPDDWIDEENDSDVSLELYITESDIDVPEYSMTALGRQNNWTVDTEGIRIREGLTLYTPTWTVGGILSDLPACGLETNDTGRAYMSMRYFVPDLADQIVSIRSMADLNDLVSGPVTPDNPLKYAAYYALDSGRGAQLLLTAVADPNDLEQWRRITDIISERDDVFHVFPLTLGDPEVNELFYEHIREMNQDEVAKERVLYLVGHDRETRVILTDYLGQPVVGRLGVESSVGSSRYAAYTVMTSGIDFVRLGVKPGDTIRTHFDFDLSGREVWTEYKITEVVNAQALRLDIDPQGVANDQVSMAFEIWRTQNNADYADAIAETGGYDDMLVRYIFSDNADPTYSPLGPAAALVGRIGAVVPHQGVSWYPLEGLPTDGWINRFSNAQLNHMAGNGVLLITKHADGYVCARHAVTTSKSPLNSDPRTSLTLKMTEEMFVRNALLIKKEFRSVVKGFVGITNNSAGTRLAIQANIEMKADQLKNDVEYPRLGGRIVEGPIDLDIRTHALFADRLVASGRVTGPVPLNSFEWDLFI